MKTEKMQQVVSDLAAKAREYNRTGNVVLRNQTIESIRATAPRAYAAKVIRDIMGK